MKRILAGEVLTYDEMLKIRGGFSINEEKDNSSLPTPPPPPPSENK